jgi:diacylglycerol kinase (ATP)
MRARLIVNPKSGPDRAPVLLPLVNERLRTIVRDLDITMTTGAGDAERAAARALEERCDALYVAGGDGTLNAVLRTLVRDDVVSPPVGVIPFGTGNDFVKALGLGEEPAAAVDHLLERRIVDVDIGMLNDRPFANTSAGGFIADVSATLTEGLKDATGKLAYIIGGARALFGTEPFSARLSLAGARESGPAAEAIDVQMFAVCNSGFIGGGYVLAPDARIDDGLVDVLVVPRMSMLEFVAVLQRMAAGADPAHPGVRRFRAAAFDLDFDRRVRVNTDGELFEAERCAYRVRRAAVPFFCGPRPHTLAAPREWSGGGQGGWQRSHQ